MYVEAVLTLQHRLYNIKRLETDAISKNYRDADVEGIGHASVDLTVRRHIVQILRQFKMVTCVRGTFKPVVHISLKRFCQH